MNDPVAVLGAGIAGVSAALHLQQRGQQVLLIDAGVPGGGASYGNAGLIEVATLLPHPCPQNLAVLARYALNRAPELRWRARDLPGAIGPLYGYWRNSRPDRIGAIGVAFRALVTVALAEHRALAEASGAVDLLRPGGWLELIRDPRALEVDRHAAVAPHGIRVDRLDRDALQRLEPDLSPDFAGALHWRDTVAIADPGAYVARLAAGFAAAGGEIVRGRVLSLTRQGTAWRIATTVGGITAARVVVALGAWSPDLLAPLGLRVPMLFKRGYHRHFTPQPGRRLNHPVHLSGSGHLAVPMAQGIRLLTGVELAHRDAPPDPRQMLAAEALARDYLPIDAAVEADPWMGSRPCLPDMLPVIGAARGQPGLWLLFGHGHHGLTEGPASARLLAEMMTGEAPFLPVAPYAPGRLGL